jgi:hypothetical protein
MERRQVQVLVFNADRYDTNDWPPIGLSQFLRWISVKAQSIPPTLRPSATVEISSESGYAGDHYPSICIAYWRDETDEEMREREQETAAGLARADAEMRKLYQQLAAKYGPL